jgi:hypothetical protein
MNQLIIFGGDIVFHLKGNFGIGVGTEYLSNTVNGLGEFNYSELIDKWWGTEFRTQNEFREESYVLKAIPILFHLYYFIPVGSKGSVFLNLGTGYYLGKYE